MVTRDKLPDKSELNISVAEYLHEKGFYPCVCHPAYYSCLQLMKYKLNICKGINYERQEGERGKEKIGTHQYLIRKTCSLLEEGRGGKLSANNFERGIKELKKLRENADYDPVEISNSDSHKAIGKAKELLLVIKKIG